MGLFSSLERTLPKQGEEVLYSYGAHSDDTLFAEYGFVIGSPANADDSIVVTRRVEKLFAKLNDAEAARKKGILEDLHYWG